jgi:hypothetical protein
MFCELLVPSTWAFADWNTRYHSIRIDVVHYCDLEEILAEKRKRRTFFERNAEPEDVPQQRLRLLCRTLRDDNTGFAPFVNFLKIPYMTRETCKADLARTIAVLPRLRYVDLPEGIFTDDPSCISLKQEVQARCPDLRKMSYHGGSERSLEVLASGNVWRNLDVLELNKLDINPIILRHVLGYLGNLRALKITDMKYLNDSIFEYNPQVPAFPALTELLLEDLPNITSAGLVVYLSSPTVQNNLITLSFTTTGVHPTNLHQILAVAPCLSKLSIIDSVTTAFPNSNSPTLGAPSQQQTPCLSSKSLEILHYEITSTGSPRYNDPSSSHYAYLSSSLLSNSLPNLKALYVRDPTFPESLIDFAPPRPMFAGEGGGSNRLSSNNPFASAINGRGLQQQLEVYTKGDNALEWNFSRVEASLPILGGGRRGSVASLNMNMRPISSYGLAAGGGGETGWGGGPVSPSWGGTFAGRDVRRSVVVGNGMGGFLAVPDGPPPRPGSSGSGTGSIGGGYRPGSSAGERDKRSSRYDMWR